jgi:hypothetical protein
MHDRGRDPREHLRVLTIGGALRSDCSVTVGLLRSVSRATRAYFARVGIGCAFGFAKQALPDEAFGWQLRAMVRGEVGSRRACEVTKYGQRKRLLRKAIAELVFKYRSKSEARVLLEKQMAVRKRQGLKGAVECTTPWWW